MKSSQRPNARLLSLCLTFCLFSPLGSGCNIFQTEEGIAAACPVHTPLEGEEGRLQQQPAPPVDPPAAAPGQEAGLKSKGTGDALKQPTPEQIEAFRKCLSACKADDKSCNQGCADKAGEEVRKGCSALSECEASSCSSTTPSTPARELCLLRNCRQAHEYCLGGWGKESCVEVVRCIGNCVDPVCIGDCTLRGSYDARVAALDYWLCMGDSCGKCGNDDSCLKECIDKKCRKSYDNCVRNDKGTHPQ